jgi:hypothetical protein
MTQVNSVRGIVIKSAPRCYYSNAASQSRIVATLRVLCKTGAQRPRLKLTSSYRGAWYPVIGTTQFVPWDGTQIQGRNANVIEAALPYMARIFR